MMMMMRQCVKQVASVGSERSVGASADNSGLVIIFFYIGLVIVFYIGRVNKNSLGL